MQSAKRLFEWYFGVPSAEPGQGTVWNLRFDAPWSGWLSNEALLLLFAAAVAGMAVVYFRDAAAVRMRGRVLLLLLRLTAAGLLLVFLSGVELAVDHVGLPAVVVMLDDSASMGLDDTYPRPEDEAAARDLLAEGKHAGASRWNLATSLLLQSDAEFLRRIQRRHKIRFYRFSDTAVPVGRSEYVTTDDLADLAAELARLRPEGKRTRPGPALQAVLDDLRGTPPAAVVLFSDGITSTEDSDRLTRGAQLARSRLVPIFAIGMGSEEPTRDVELYDLLVDEVAFVNDPLAFSAWVKGHGYSGQSVTAVLKEQGSGEVLARKSITLGADGEAVKLEMQYAPPKAGEFDYVLELPALPGETNPENNSEVRHVSVREEKIRVLLVDMTPRWEFRFVKHLLEREPTIELRTVLLESDGNYTAEDETALPHFPLRREEFLPYDVIILGDVDPAQLNSTAAQNLHAFVRDAGGGLIVVAGPLHSPAALRGTELEVMLPVELPGAASATGGSVPLPDGFRPVLTVDGRKGTPIFRFAESEEENSAAWDRLPPLYWLCDVAAVKPGARVFVEYRPLGNASTVLPVIALSSFGGGKVLFHATDDLWRWRFRAGDLYYGRYWIQAIRYLSRSKLLGRDRSAELTVDRLVYEQGDSVKLRVRFFDERLVPREGGETQVMVERRGDVRHTVTLTRRADAPGVFEGELPVTAPGSYHAWVVAPSFAQAPPSTDFRVEEPLGELARRGLDRRELQQAAEVSRGAYFSLAEAAQVPDDLPAGAPVPLKSQDPLPLWNRPELLILFTLVLTTEWLLRKRFRLL